MAQNNNLYFSEFRNDNKSNAKKIFTFYYYTDYYIDGYLYCFLNFSKSL